MPSPVFPFIDDPKLALIRDRSASHLRDNVLPFWMRNTRDETHGGFITHLDRNGNRSGVSDKFLVMQARMVWTLAAAHRHGITGKGYLETARLGVEYLLDRMWDSRYGGFFWSVRADGTPLSDCKWLYGQAFAIYALSEYALASGDVRALDWAVKLFDWLQKKALDGNRGYLERFGRSWRLPWRRRRWAKTLDVHMHLMEAFTKLAEASGDEKHRASLRYLVDLIVRCSIHPQYGCGVDSVFNRNWSRKRIHHERRFATSYGHNAELAWLLLEASRVLEEPLEARLATAVGLVDHMLAYGFDHERGGVAMYGPFTGPVTEAKDLPARRLHKNWWEQAETLAALAELLRLTGRDDYRRAFKLQFKWIWERQIDHDEGDWHRTLSWDGTEIFTGVKGDEWKCPYHNSRALMRVGSILAGR